MASEKTSQAQAQRHRQVTAHFRAFARLARETPNELPDAITAPMQERVRRIYELHHAIALNEEF